MYDPHNVMYYYSNLTVKNVHTPKEITVIVGFTTTLPNLFVSNVLFENINTNIKNLFGIWGSGSVSNIKFRDSNSKCFLLMMKWLMTLLDSLSSLSSQDGGLR